MPRFCCEQEAAQNLLAVLGVTASGETAQITAQVFEPAFTQVGRAQPMLLPCREGKEGQYTFQLSLEFLHHLWRGPAPASTESPCPVPRLRLVLRLPDPPELPPLEPSESWHQRFQAPKPLRQAELMPGRRIHHLGRTEDRGQSITHDQFHPFRPSLAIGRRKRQARPLKCAVLLPKGLNAHNTIERVGTFGGSIP